MLDQRFAILKTLLDVTLPLRATPVHTLTSVDRPVGLLPTPSPVLRIDKPVGLSNISSRKLFLIVFLVSIYLTLSDVKYPFELPFSKTKEIET